MTFKIKNRWGWSRKILKNLAVASPSLKKYKKRNLGFTLIELLIVIAIIGLLSSVVLASLNSARKKARDARRIVDFRQFQIALELFYDKTGFYPISPSAGPWYGHWQNFTTC